MDSPTITSNTPLPPGGPVDICSGSSHPLPVQPATCTGISTRLDPSQTGGSGLSEKSVSVCPFHQFERPEFYEEKAQANMKLFLEKNVQHSKNKPPVSFWLSQEEARDLSSTAEEARLLLLINDLDELMSALSGKKKQDGSIFCKPEHMPFEYHSGPDQLLKNIRSSFKQIFISVMQQSPYCSAYELTKKRHPNLTDAEIIDHERLLVRIMTHLIKNNKEIALNRVAVLASFMASKKCSKGSDVLIQLSPEAFGRWVNVQLSLKELLSNCIKNSTDPEIIKSIHHFLWALFDQGMVSSEQVSQYKNEILDYMKFYIFPSHLLPHLFKTPITTVTSCSHASKLETSDISPTNITTELLTFGEEFEYLTAQGEKFDTKAAHIHLTNWSEHLQAVLSDKDITDFSITPSCNPEHLIESLDIRIGDWHCKVYLDYDVLEVNTTPYRMDQMFTVMNKTVSSYQMFDEFVFPIAKNLKLTARSGHKHIGIAKAFHGNREVLLRLWLDVEKRGWLPRLFQREGRSENQFRYLKQDIFIELFIINSLITAFNHQLTTYPEREKTEDFTAIRKMRDTMQKCALWREKTVPLNLLHLDDDSDREAEGGVKQARTTIEFRFPQVPPSGEKARLLSGCKKTA